MDRVVINKNHYVFDSNDKWRSEVLQSKEMTEQRTQLVYIAKDVAGIVSHASRAEEAVVRRSSGEMIL